MVLLDIHYEKIFHLTGFNEVRYSEKDKKVIYEPVKTRTRLQKF